MHREYIWKITDYFPLIVQRIINRYINNRWPVWGYHMKDGDLWNKDKPKNSFNVLTKFMKDNDIKWEYKRVKGYTHITIFNHDGAKKFCKKYNFSI